MGDEIRMPLTPFLPKLFGDLIDEIMEEARERFPLAFGSSSVRFEGRYFSTFLAGEGCLCGASAGTGAGAGAGAGAGVG